jgi:CDP-paratose 2-epimerase
MQHNNGVGGGTTLITGGAGFIGSHLAAHLLATTDSHITLLDDLSHHGSARNLKWLKTFASGGRLKLIRGDVRDAATVKQAANTANEIYHLATSTAPSNDSSAPEPDFDVSVSGTINLLEAARQSGRSPMVLFASSSLIYGATNCVPLKADVQRYSPVDPAFRGYSESTPVDLYSPCSCVVGAADRSVRDYARIYHLPTVVFRIDSVAGARQVPDRAEGWAAQLVDSVLADKPVTIGEDSLQVHDVLHVADLIDAIVAARAYLGVTAGKAYNIGGGPSHSVSQLEMLELVERLCHRKSKRQFREGKADGMGLYISDSSAFSKDTGWRPRRSLEQTIRDISACWHATHYGVHGHRGTVTGQSSHRLNEAA